METLEEPQNVNVRVIREPDMSDRQRQDIRWLQEQCFGHIGKNEIEEDFYSPNVAWVMAHQDDELVGYGGIHKTEVVYEERKINLGGFGVCTREDMRRRGVATRMCTAAMELLELEECDIAFLSIDLSQEGVAKLYENLGFIHLPKMFSWKNVHGDTKQDTGGMIAPVGSQELFEHVLKGTDVFHVGDGYW